MSFALLRRSGYILAVLSLVACGCMSNPYNSVESDESSQYNQLNINCDENSNILVYYLKCQL